MLPHQICSSTSSQLRLLSSTHLASLAQPCFIRLNCISICSTGRLILPLAQRVYTERYHHSRLAYRPVKVSHPLITLVPVPFNRLMGLPCYEEHFCPGTAHLLFSLFNPFHRVPRSCICSHAARSKRAQTNPVTIWKSIAISPEPGPQQLRLHKA